MVFLLIIAAIISKFIIKRYKKYFAPHTTWKLCNHRTSETSRSKFKRQARKWRLKNNKNKFLRRNLQILHQSQVIGKLRMMLKMVGWTTQIMPMSKTTHCHKRCKLTKMIIKTRKFSHIKQRLTSQIWFWKISQSAIMPRSSFQSQCRIKQK